MKVTHAELDAIQAFIEAAIVDLEDPSGRSLERAQAIRAQHASLIGKDTFTASILGDDETLAELLAEDPSAAGRAGGPYDWDPLRYLAFSRYLCASSGEGTPTAGRFVVCARLLLERGASVNTAIYGAAGVAQHLELTRLLLERDADPNDEETAYHVSETRQNDVVRLLLASGKLDERSRTTILHRKLDWHDLEGVRLALDHGADPNLVSPWGRVALEHSLSRYNAVAFVDLLMERGATPKLRPLILRTAARHGRDDALRRFGATAHDLEEEEDRLIAAAALDDQDAIARYREAAVSSPAFKNDGGTLLAQFAGIGNTKGIANLLDCGVLVNATWDEGFGYLEIAERSTALHVAAWCARHEAVALLIQRGAAIDPLDGRGRTPLTLAARACTASWWTDRRAADSVKSLLAAGADPSLVSPIDAPPGFDDVDRLLGR